MFISKKQYYEEIDVLLQEGVDFKQEDLEPNALVGGRLSELTSKARNEIAFRLGYQQMYFCGHYNEDTKTVRCSLRRPLFVDEERACCYIEKAKEN